MFFIKQRKIKNKAKNIKLIAMDVDGVLTRGEIIVLESGEEVKIFNVKDRLSFGMGKHAGIKFAFISARGSKELEIAAKELKVDEIYLHRRDKLDALKEIINKFSLTPQEVAYIGDDLYDISALKMVGFSVAPQDAAEIVKKNCFYVSRYKGGEGVLREVVEIVLKSKNIWEKVLEKYY